MHIALNILRKFLKITDSCFCLTINWLPLSFDQKKYACYKIQKTLRNASFLYSDNLSMKQLLMEQYEKRFLSAEDELIYKNRLDELQKAYKRVYILRPQAMNMGNMCVNYWVWR